MPDRADMELEATEAVPKRSARSLPKIVWQRKSLVAVSTLAGLLFGFAFYAQRPPVYQSTAQVLVVKKRSDPLPITGGDPRLTFVEDYLSTHLVLIKSPLIVERAVQKRELGSLPSYAGRGDPSGEIMASLTALRDKDASGSGGPNNIINLAFRAPMAEDCGTVLNAIVESYQDFLDVSYRSVSDDTLGLITRARETLKNDLAEAEKKYAEFHKNSPLLFKGKDGINIYQERIAGLESKRSALLIRRTELEKRLAVIDQAAKDGHGRSAVMAFLAADHADAKTGPVEQTLEDKLLPLQLQELQLSESFGDDHPDVRSVQKRIAMIREKAKRPTTGKGAADEKDKATEEAAAHDEAVAADPAARYVEGLRQQLEEAKEVSEALKQQLGDLHSEARAMRSYEVEEEHLRGDILGIQQLHEGTIKRLAEINLVREAGGFDARTIAKPGTGAKVAPNALQFSFGGLALGLLAGIGLAYLVELSDKGFRTPEEIRRRLGLPVIGHIPLLSPDEGARAQLAAGQLVVDALLCTYYRPKSVDAEAYRAVRTALYFSTHGEKHKLVQVTSPDMGDGKSTLITNLAVSIAQSGKRTLLIDADLRRPRLHKMLAVPGEVGLAGVIAGTAELSSAVRETPVNGLFVLPSGPPPPNPAELLTSPRLEELLDAVREQYDFVLVDTPPLLAVTDPCVVAPRVDGVILAIRLSKQSGPQAERAKEILATLGAKVLGVVVNGVNRRESSRRFGAGQYEYTYSQADYAYNGEQEEKSYYDDPESTEDTSTGEAKHRPPSAAAGDKRRHSGRASIASGGILQRILSWWA
jgi:succinoglycan biosynthesis transport protein ExoP